MARKWLLIGGGVAIAVTTIIGLFTFLMIRYDFQITDLTGNFVCPGTFNELCVSEFDVRNPNNYDVDIYNKYQVKLNFSPEIEDYALFVQDKRCSATGKCRCELADGRMIGFEDWRCVDFTNKTKPRQDRVYVFRFPRYTTKHFRLAGIKKNPTDTVKWSFGTEGGELDPVWIGVDESQKLSIPVVEYEPAYNDLQVNITGDEIRITWDYYEVFDNETNETHTHYRGNATIRTRIKYNGNNLTYSFAQMSPLGVKYGLGLVSNDGMTAEWNGSVNLGNVQTLMKDNGFQPAFEIDGAYGVKGNKLYIDPHISIEWKDRANPLNKFRIQNKNLVLLTNNGSAFHDTLTYDPIILVENITINSKLNNVRTDDTFAYLEIDDSDDVYLEFDGAGDSVNVGDLDNVVENIPELTISAWAKPNVAGTGAKFVARKDNTFRAYVTSNLFTMRVYNTSGDWVIEGTDNYYADTDWHHVVWVYNGSILVYVDGALDVASPVVLGGNTQTSTGNLLISYNDWDGSIDEVRIYNTSLSARDISEIYNSTRVANSSIPNSSDLVGWWQMDEGVSGTAFDSSQESNDGTLVGDTSWSTWGIGDNLVGAWIFDGDAVNTKLTQHFDFTKHNNDGTGAGDAVTNASDCMDNYGNCLQLDGDGDRITTSSVITTVADNFTFSVWAKPNTGASGQTQIVFNNGDTGDGYIRWRNTGWDFILPSATATTTAGTIGVWQHVVVKLENATAYLYLNGVETVGNSDITLPSPSGFAAIGSRGSTTGAFFFNGSIDEVMIFNTSLSAAQIKAIYYNSSHRFKEVGNHTILPVNISDGYDRANVTVEFSNNMSSNISLRLGQINITSHNQTGLVAYYPMEWGSSTDNQVWDISGQDNHGTPYGFSETTLSGWNSTGGLNETGGWELDGNEDYVTTGFTPSNFTLSIWVNPNSLTSGNRIWSMGDAKAELLLWNNNYNLYGGGYDMYPAGAAATIGKWEHVVSVVEQGVIASLYLNGIHIESDSSISETSLDALNIGRKSSGGNFFNGSIDEVMIFNRALSPTEISQMYNDTIEEYNQIYYTTWANLTSGSNIHTIDEEADFLFAQLRYYPGNGTNNPFYTPILRNNITIETLQVNDAPTHNNPNLTATDAPSNLTTANLTCYNQSTFDKDYDNVKNIYNWYVNDTPIAVLNMPFENNGTNGGNLDYSGLNNDGTVIGAIWNSTGGYDGRGAYEFDGAGDYVEIDEDALDNIQNITLSAWINPIDVAVDSYGTVIAQGGGAHRILLRESTGRFTVSINDRSIIVADTGVSYTLNQWQHVVLTSVSGDTDFYLNGVKTDVSSNTGTISETESWRIGIRSSDSLPFNGTIDDVLIFNRALSAEQIWQLYIQNTSDYSPMLIVSDETGVDDEWICEVTPNDGTEDGIAKNSTALTIESAVPDPTAPDNVGFLLPTPLNDTNLTQNNYLVNVSYHDENPNSCLLELTNTSGTINYTMTQGANLSEWYINTSHSNNMTHFTAYCRDDAGNWNHSETRSVNISVTAVGDTCDTCNIDCDEACTVDSNLDCQTGFNATGSSPYSGPITIEAEINITEAYANVSMCYFNCTSGRCFV